MKPGPTAPERDSTVAALLDGSADRVLRLFGARGLLPLGVEERLRVLLTCRNDTDAEVAGEAAASIARVLPEEWLSFLDLGAISASEVEILASSTDDPLVLERLVRLRTTPDSVLVRIAREGPAAVLEALVVNQTRLLAHPPIIDAAEANSALPADCRRLLREIREEFFEKAAKRRDRADAAPSPEGPEPEASAPTEESAPGEETPEEVQRRMAINQRIAYMNASEKIETALKGTREERRILITDVNKSVWAAVLKCPYLTDVELEGFAAMRSVDEGVFRAMALKPDWLRKYGVVYRLVNNPVVPAEISMGLVKFLRMRDLKLVMNDRNLPEAVRVTARKIYLIRRA
ncbi:MAG: hypothetical protein ACRD16_15465 [Thermoanaerobaculia bacterium]